MIANIPLRDTTIATKRHLDQIIDKKVRHKSLNVGNAHRASIRQLQSFIKDSENEGGAGYKRCVKGCLN